MLPRLFCIAILLVVSLQPALAQGNGNGNGNGQGNGSSQGNGQGNDGGNGLGLGLGNGGTSDQSPGNANGLPAQNGVELGSGNSQKPAGAGPKTTELTQDQASDVVSSGKAVPLGTIVQSLEQRAAGKIVDAKLLQVGETLVYAVKVISADGRVSTEYFYARSGRFIGSQ